MKFTGALISPRFSLTAYRRAMDKCLREAVAQAVMEWLEATVIAEVPVWSGASRATFIALGRKIEYNIPIFPAAPSRTSQGEAQSDGDLVADPMTGRYVFTYMTTLPWLIVNEYFDATVWGFHLKKPGPYEFQLKGQAAFRKFAQTVRLPNPFDSLKLRRIKVG